MIQPKPRYKWADFFHPAEPGVGPISRSNWLEWGLLLILTLWFCSGFLDLGTNRPVNGFLAETFQLSDQILLNSLRQHGRLPQWNFYIDGGLSFVADPMLHAYNPDVTLPVVVLGVLGVLDGN